MNKFFNIKRFWNVLKIDFRLYSTPLIINTAITVSFFLLLVFVAPTWFMWEWLLFASIVGVITVPGEICGNVRNSNNFRYYFLLPVSNFERFLARMLICHIIPLVVFVTLSFLLYLSDYVVNYIHYNSVTFPVHIIVLFMILWLTSLNTFFGTLFRKGGDVAFVVFMALLVFFGSFILEEINLMFLDPIVRYVQKDQNSFGRLYLVVGCISAVFSLINYAAAYFVYSRKELNVKLFNW